MSAPSTHSQTDRLRSELRGKRRGLTPAQQQQAAARLADRLSALPVFRTSRRIACYLPNDGEIDPRLLMERILARRQRCYLPVLSPLRGEPLWFAPVTEDTPMDVNRFGIPEPVVPFRQQVRAQALDLILMPLVGFDTRGNRIGMGGGFYDRSLGFLVHRRHWQHPRLLGLAHELQRIDHIEPRPWDVPLDGIVTDLNYYPANR